MINIKKINDINCTYNVAYDFNKLCVNLRVNHRKCVESRIKLKDVTVLKDAELKLCLPSVGKSGKHKGKFSYKYSDIYYFVIDTRQYENYQDAMNYIFDNVQDLYLIPNLQGMVDDDYCVDFKKQNEELLRVMRQIGY